MADSKWQTTKDIQIKKLLFLKKRPEQIGKILQSNI